MTSTVLDQTAFTTTVSNAKPPSLNKKRRDLTDTLKEKVLFLTNGAIHVNDVLTAAVDKVAENQMTVEVNLNSIDVPTETEHEDGGQLQYPTFEVGPFEGVEKRLIVEFYPEALLASSALSNGSLRSLSSEQWQEVLNKAACQILSFKELESSGGSCTAYLLSESSLFVYDHRIILKTCGTTTPLLALPTLLSFVIGESRSLSSSATQSSVVEQATTNEAATKLVKGVAPCLPFDTLSLASLTTSGSLGSLSLDVIGSSSAASFSSFQRWCTEQEDISCQTVRCSSQQDDYECLSQRLSQASSPSPTITPSPSVPDSLSQLVCSSSDDQWVATPRCDDDASTGLTGSSVPVCVIPAATCMSSFSPGNRQLGESGISSEQSVFDVHVIGVDNDPDESRSWVESRASSVISWVFFSHLTYCFPHKQRYPHRSNAEEVAYLERFFQNKENSLAAESRDVFSLRTSESREFFVYAYGNPTMNQTDGVMEQPPLRRPFIISELMMLNIDECCVDEFAGKGCGYNADIETRNASVHRVMKPVEAVNHRGTLADELLNKEIVHPWKSVLDQFWFKPCGYSCNALMEDPATRCASIDGTPSALSLGPHFATAHISPESESSYASLEVTFPFKQANRMLSSYPMAKSGFNENTRAHDTSTAAAFQLCPVDALSSFNPQHLHVVDLELYGDRDGKAMLGGVERLNSRSHEYTLVSVKEHRGNWFHVRHAEYVRHTE